MSIHGVLGETTGYPQSYSPSVLFPIARAVGREQILQANATSADVLCIGVDWWHCFELSWLNSFGISQVAMARLTIPASSTHIVESKSLKLYLNSFNLTQFASAELVKTTITEDLSAIVHSRIEVQLFELNHGGCDNQQDASNLSTALRLAKAGGICIDEAWQSLANSSQSSSFASLFALTDNIDASLLQLASSQQPTVNPVQQSYHSHLLRSNCPVTNQPDWGTVQIDITCDTINQVSLLAYLLSYRQHNGFHEQCVEQIFADLQQCFQPTQLMVRAWYTRRGGIDINPCRVSDISLLPQPSRLVRQ